MLVPRGLLLAVVSQRRRRFSQVTSSIDSPKHTVLLVEDDPNDRLMTEHAFERSAPGISLQTAVDGEEAVAYLSGQGTYADRATHPFPQLVLLDLKLPRKSGMEVLQWIRTEARLQTLVVFILSSSQERADIDRAFALGATAYMVKQVELRAIREIVRGIGEYVRHLPRATRAPGE